MRYGENKIGTKTYNTLKSAFNAVKDGETITLLNNIDVNPGSSNPSDFCASLEDGKSVTFNMNGYNIKSPYTTFTTNGTSSLNIIGNGKISSYGGASINNNSTGIVTINEGVICSNSGPTPIANNNTGTIVLNGATVKQENSSCTAIVINKGVIYIKNNAEISSAGTGIVNKEGTVYVEENASISCGASYGIENNATGTVILGKDDGIINSTTPKVSAGGKAAIKNEGILKFYDGICTSGSSPVFSNSGTIIAPTGGSVVYGSYNSTTKFYQEATASKN